MPSSGFRGSRQPKTPDSILDDFMGRRSGLLRALTIDIEDLYTACDPDSENLCLYGNPDETWEIDLPADQVPAELPEPTIGINFARDGMSKEDWAVLVAVHCDCWLIAVASYFAFRLDASGRAKIYKGLNSLPTLFEAVTSEYAPNSLRQKQQRRMREQSTAHTVPHSSRRRNADGKLLTYRDIQPNLKGRQAELYWPDDELWYLVEIHSISSRQRSAKIQYSTGEYEDLDLDEIIREGHMSLLL